jgi:2-oxo-4-hydroxy-4-carboxy-5-ureidoimidazoline decarboxylase
MMAKRPFISNEQMIEEAKKIWADMKKSDYIEAFSGHPKIGDIDSLRKKFSSTQSWTSQEQSGVAGAEEEILKGLARGNAEYEKKFGYIFIVCATGKTAKEMLDILRDRLKNPPEKEIQNAAKEQEKILQIRLEKLMQ